MTPAARLTDLAARLRAFERRLGAACAAAGRDPAEVTTVAVSKTWPAADVLVLYRLGVGDFGENYDREAAAKAAALRAAGVLPCWHFVGSLQRNKCRSVASYADVVHSLDRPELVDALGAAARRAKRVVEGFVQVSYDGDPGRGGCPPAEVADLAARVAATPGLRLLGLMTVAPPDRPPRPVFAALRGLAATVAAAHPGATAISAGMTGDLEDAVAEGATHVRVGSALFGPRPEIVR